MSCFGYSVASILGMSSALKFADTFAGKPFGCMTPEEVVDLRNYHVCQLYGIRIFSGVSQESLAYISRYLYHEILAVFAFYRFVHWPPQ